MRLTGERCDDLDLTPMVRAHQHTESHGTVDLAAGTTTGISAADRAATLRVLADPAVGAQAFNRPEHIFLLCARPGGVLKHIGHTEASVDLARLAGRAPTGVLCEVVLDFTEGPAISPSTSAPRSWAAGSSVHRKARGRTRSGRGGGATTRRFTCRSSC